MQRIGVARGRHPGASRRRQSARYLSREPWTLAAAGSPLLRPPGLVLSHLPDRAGIESVVLETVL